MWNVRLADFDHVLVQAALDEKARVAKEKELETARLRAKQEKAADRQAEIDELRARRCASVCAPTENFLHAWQVLDSHCFLEVQFKNAPSQLYEELVYLHRCMLSAAAATLFLAS